MKKLFITIFAVLGFLIPSFSLAVTNEFLNKAISVDSILNANWDYPQLTDGVNNFDSGYPLAGWSSSNSAFPHWGIMDLGAGVTKAINRIKISPRCPTDDTNCTVKDWSLFGSSDNSTWGNAIATGTVANSGDSVFQTFNFTASTTAYRYWKWQIDSNSDGTNYGQVREVEGYVIAPPSAPTQQVIWFDE